MYPSHESEVRIDKWLAQGHILGKVAMDFKQNFELPNH